jgi:putative aldouronate transport system substrate-binding protein
MGKFRMKKVYFLICVIFVLLSTGCGKKHKIGTEKNPYNIIWYSFGVAPQNLPDVLKKVNEYTRKKIGVTVDLKMQGIADYTKKMQMIQASGEPFDMCFTCSWVNDYRLNVSKGYFLPLNDLLKKYGQGIIKVLNPLFLEGTRINGENYAIPTNKEIAYQLVYRFNKKYVDKYNFNISDIKSLKDLEPMFKVIKENEPGIVPFAIYPSDYLLKDLDYIIRSSIPGAVLIKKGNHKIINQYVYKGFTDYMRLYHKYYELGYIPKSVALSNGKDSALEKSGKWFCDVAGYQPEADMVWSRLLDFPIVSIPAFKPPIIASTSVAGAMIAISSTSERPDLCMKFLNLLNTDKYLRNLLGYGIEGINYKKVGDNVIE